MISKEAVAVEEARETIEILSAHFKIPMPKIVLGRRRNCTLPRRHIIRLCPNSRSTLSWTDTVLHEFAHVLNYQQNGSARGRIHQKGFFHALVDTIRAWRGDIHRYAWEKEYLCVRKRYEKLNGKSN